LPNRHRLSALFLDLVTQRDADPLAVLLINLDRFRSVNDTLGAANGDDLLREAARRIVASVPTAEAVSHLDGDEFVVLLAQRLARDELDATAHVLLAELARPYQLGAGRPIFLPASASHCTHKTGATSPPCASAQIWP